MSDGSVEIKDLIKTYVDDRGRPTFTAVKKINLHIDNGEFMVLVGPSGCGKTTTLRMVAGLEKITSGTISIGDRVVNDLEPKDRGIAMVPEDRHQGARGEPHLFKPVEKAAHLLIRVCNFAGVTVPSVSLLVRFRGIIRSMRIEIVRPQEKPLLPILREPLESAFCDHRRAALCEYTGQVILFGLVPHVVVVGRETVCKAELFGENA